MSHPAHGRPEHRGPTAASRLAAVAVVLAGLAVPAAGSASAADSYGTAFVDAFAETCVPGRLSYPGTLLAAKRAGWSPVGRGIHPGLDALMEIAEREMLDAELDDATFEYRLFMRPVAGTEHHLVVSRGSFVFDDPDDPWAYIGCYLYNFSADGPIDPAPVTALIENPISYGLDQDGLVSHVWGPPCPMPRTGDTYLTYIAPDSPHIAQTGFSGLMMKFDTSEPGPDEIVPETYC